MTYVLELRCVEHHSVSAAKFESDDNMIFKRLKDNKNSEIHE